MSGINSVGIVNEGEIWLANFPLEEDPTQYFQRPVIVLNTDGKEVLSIKVTRHSQRSNDPYDTPIIHWREAGLDSVSTARVSKTMLVDMTQFKHKIGDVWPADLKTIQNIYMAYITQKQKSVRYGSP